MLRPPRRRPHPRRSRPAASPREHSQQRPQRLAAARERRARPASPLAGSRRPRPLPRQHRPSRTRPLPPLRQPHRPAAAKPAPDPPAPAGRDAYQKAQALASRGRYAQAAASFARLSAAGPRAELALYERGLLLLKKLEEPAQARRVFLEHRRRFPESELGPEVDVSLIEASLRAKELPDAAREIDAFLARYPANERRDELRLLRANLARDGGDCARAEREYQVARARDGQARRRGAPRLGLLPPPARRRGGRARSPARVPAPLPLRAATGGDVEQALGAGR